MRTIREIADRAYWNMGKYNQITIDLIEEAEMIDEDSTDYEKGSLRYRVGNTLAICNPELANDFEALTDLSETLK